MKIRNHVHNIEAIEKVTIWFDSCVSVLPFNVQKLYQCSRKFHYLVELSGSKTVFVYFYFV